MAKEQPWIDVPIQILISHHTWKLPFDCEHKYDLWHHQWSKVFENICRFGFKCNCGSSGYQGLICSLPTKPRSCHQVTPSWHFHNTCLFIVDSKHTPPTFIPGLSPRIQGQKDNRSRRGWTSPPSKPALRFWQWWSCSVKGGDHNLWCQQCDVEEVKMTTVLMKWCRYRCCTWSSPRWSTTWRRRPRWTGSRSPAPSHRGSPTLLLKRCEQTNFNK